MDKKKSLEGLLGKLDTEIRAEQQSGANFLSRTSSTNQPHLTNPLRPPKLDPLTMSPKVSQARQRRQAMQQKAKARHSKIIKIPEEVQIDDDDGSSNDLKDVDDSKFKTMDWIEPDGSKTKLRFDENGTLLGKQVGKRRR